ncbi:hypothetical protein A6283_12890 [Bacillus wiedmannii]|nr:hypothetical protein A6283_12890 [Bacillus wiedmannii]OAK39107.1 hypothetical protein A6286_07295 [Bacillus wiedmannii]PHB68227.1 hypothetical protein COE89_26085 [Bacillus wiedmannii]
MKQLFFDYRTRWLKYLYTKREEEKHGRIQKGSWWAYNKLAEPGGSGLKHSHDPGPDRGYKKDPGMGI